MIFNCKSNDKTSFIGFKLKSRKTVFSPLVKEDIGAGAQPLNFPFNRK